MTWLSDLIPPPHARESLTLLSYLRYVALPFLCFYTTAILVLIPNTLVIRLAILPLSLYTFFTGATRLDITKPHNDERLAYIYQSWVLSYMFMSMRTIVWSIQTQPCWRVKTLGEVTPQFYAAGPLPLRIRQVFPDALDLCHNIRGCGWNWSRHLKIPRETRPTSSTRAFAIVTLASLLRYLAFLDASQYAVQWISPILRTARGGSIFDTNLSPSIRYPTSFLLMALIGLFLYSYIQIVYHIMTLFGALIFRQDISLWPPVFDTPWMSTSLTEFWGRRWHQLLRNVCTTVGQKCPPSPSGCTRRVFAAFLTSGIFHSLFLWGIGRGADFMHVTGFLMANGTGVVLEDKWRELTGNRMGGWYGMSWRYMWFFGSVGVFMDAWATRGFFDSSFLPLSLRLTTHFFDPLL